MNTSRPISAVAILAVLLGCTPTDMTTAGRVALANPAAVACVGAGGQPIAMPTSYGQYGMCKLPSGKVCEEWALFRGECG